MTVAVHIPSDLDGKEPKRSLRDSSYGTDPESEHFRPPHFSDEALALQFAQEHVHDLRFVAAWGRWLELTGTHWQYDETLRAYDLARKVCGQAAAGFKKPKIAATIASAETVAAVERMARSDRRLA